MRAILYIAALIITACSSPKPENIYSEQSIESITTIMDLKSHYLGSTHQITEDLIIQGRVTANDMFGELDGRIVLQDDSGGIEVYIDGDDLHSSYPLNNTLTLNCSGLWFASRGDSYGALVMGDYPTSYDPVDGISSQRLSARLISNETDETTYTPNRYTLSQISTSLISSCIILESIKFQDVDTNESLLDYDQYDELGYCRRTMECMTSGLTIELYIPYTLDYRNVTIAQIENYDNSYYVLVDRYNGYYSIQLIGMGRY